MSNNIHVRPVTEEELSILEDFANKENWFASDHLIRACYTYDPEGFLAAVDSSNQPLGFVAACNLTDNIACISFLVVKQDVRGHSIGLLLMDEAERRVYPRNVIINSVLERAEIYRKRKFSNSLCEINCYVCTPQLNNLEMSLKDVQIRKLTDETFPALVEYDERVHVLRREKFLSKFLFGVSASTLFATKDGAIAGYGCIYKRKQKSYVIGPLFADDIDIARVLLNNLLVEAEVGSSVSCDVPITSNGAQQLVESYGFQCCVKTLRMTIFKHPPVQWQKVFFATTTEISVI